MHYLTARDFARHHRKNPTLAERFFWERVRNRQLVNRKFYRQYIMAYHHDPGHRQFFIVDFYCHECNLVVELDGGIHEIQKEEDAWREGKLREMGYRVVRFCNEEVLSDWDVVEQRLLELLVH